jgi:hypothetical protein
VPPAPKIVANCGRGLAGVTHSLGRFLNPASSSLTRLVPLGRASSFGGPSTFAGPMLHWTAHRTADRLPPNPAAKGREGVNRVCACFGVCQEVLLGQDWIHTAAHGYLRLTQSKNRLFLNQNEDLQS